VYVPLGMHVGEGLDDGPDNVGDGTLGQALGKVGQEVKGGALVAQRGQDPELRTGLEQPQLALRVVHGEHAQVGEDVGVAELGPNTPDFFLVEEIE
jgi:hypothetical protein